MKSQPVTSGVRTSARHIAARKMLDWAKEAEEAVASVQRGEGPESVAVLDPALMRAIATALLDADDLARELDELRAQYEAHLRAFHGRDDD